MIASAKFCLISCPALRETSIASGTAFERIVQENEIRGHPSDIGGARRRHRHMRGRERRGVIEPVPDHQRLAAGRRPEPGPGRPCRAADTGNVIGRRRARAPRRLTGASRSPDRISASTPSRQPRHGLGCPPPQLVGEQEHIEEPAVFREDHLARSISMIRRKSPSLPSSAKRGAAEPVDITVRCGRSHPVAGRSR
jgi:hypothetical protein